MMQRSLNLACGLVVLACGVDPGRGGAGGSSSVSTATAGAGGTSSASSHSSASTTSGPGPCDLEPCNCYPDKCWAEACEPLPADCDDCWICVFNGPGKCSDLNCVGNNCAAWEDCRNACPINDATCAAACDEMYPEGAAYVQKQRECLCGECGGQCAGKWCGGGAGGAGGGNGPGGGAGGM